MLPQEVIRKRVQHFNDPGHAHFLTFSCYGRLDLLDRDDLRESLLNRLAQVSKKQSYGLWSYVLMPNHVHLLVKPRLDAHSISSFLHDLKFFVGFHALRKLKSGGALYPAFWKAGPGYDRNIYDVDTALRAAEYIHNNPVRKGLVEAATDWRWSSARFWAGHEEFDLVMDEIV